MNRRVIIITVLILSSGMLYKPSPLHAQKTCHGNDDAPGDPGPGDPSVSALLEDGSAIHPFDAIQEGIHAASPFPEALA